MKKRILAFILCICMMLELIPSSVYAAENGESTVVPVKETVSGGDVSGNDVTGEDISGNQDVSGNDDVSDNNDIPTDTNLVSGDIINFGHKLISEYRAQGSNKVKDALAGTGKGFHEVDGYWYYLTTGGDIYNTIPIRWVVIEDEGDTLLLMQEYVFEGYNFDPTTDGSNLEWANSAIREYVNNDSYFNKYFTEDEKNDIQVSTVKNTAAGHIDAEGTTTQDRIFLPSVKEMDHYFEDSQSRIAHYYKDLRPDITTPMVGIGDAGAYDTTNFTCAYWTRTPYEISYGYSKPALVDASGSVCTYSRVYNTWSVGIRPMLRINKNSLHYEKAAQNVTVNFEKNIMYTYAGEEVKLPLSIKDGNNKEYKFPYYLSSNIGTMPDNSESIVPVRTTKAEVTAVVYGIQPQKVSVSFVLGIKPAIPEVSTQIEGKELTISWTEKNDARSSGYEIQRSTSKDGEYVTIASDVNNGSSSSDYYYRNFTDKTAEPDVEYWYRVRGLYQLWNKDTGYYFSAEYGSDKNMTSEFSEPVSGKIPPIVKNPVANQESGDIIPGTEVTLSTETKGAKIYYTLNGDIPTKDSYLYTTPLVIKEDTNIRAIAIKDGYLDSDVVKYTYTIPIFTVTYDYNGGTGNFFDSWPVRYGEKAFEPLDPPVKEGMNFMGWYLNDRLYDFNTPVTSDITLVVKWKDKEALPLPKANLWTDMAVLRGTKITLSNVKKDATIYYTLDGTEPTINSQIYTAPIVVNEEITIKAFAVKDGYKDSEVATFHYTISEDEDIWGDVDPDDIPEDGIPDGMWVAGVTDMEYTGKPIKPAIRVYDGKTRLTEKKDYTVTYKNNTNAAGRDAVKAPSITVTGKGNYEGKTTITFAILPQDISEDNPLMIADNLTTAYNGKAQKPVPVITFAGKKLIAKKDYVVTCTDTTTGTYKEAGTYDIILNGVGNYTGTRVITYTVTELIPISKVKVSNIKPYTYDWYGSYEYYPEFTLKDGKYTLIENEDYVVTYLNNNQVGTAYLLIEGIGRYTGTRRVPFKINGYSISKGSVWYRGNGKYTYNGEPHTPECYVEVSTGHNSYTTLYENEGFTLQFINNVNAGKATLIFTGINGYSGTLKRTIKIDPFDIAADTEDAFHVELETEVGFCKIGATPKPVITFNGTILTEGKDYTLKYANNKKVAGSGDLKAPTVTITGKGNFKGTRTVTFDIVPQDLSNLSLEAADKVFQNKAKNYTTKFDVLDSNGKKLAVKKDYEIVKYAYADGSEVKDTDIIPAGTEIFVTVKAKEGSGFTGELTGSYRIVQADISKVAAKVTDQTYTGSAITPGKEEITLTMKKVPLAADDYEIVSYSNNVKKGTATVIIRGVGNYGGTKKITFKIKSKKVGFLWW